MGRAGPATTAAGAATTAGAVSAGAAAAQPLLHLLVRVEGVYSGLGRIALMSAGNKSVKAIL